MDFFFIYNPRFPLGKDKGLIAKKLNGYSKFGASEATASSRGVQARPPHTFLCFAGTAAHRPQSMVAEIFALPQCRHTQPGLDRNTPL